MIKKTDNNLKAKTEETRRDDTEKGILNIQTRIEKLKVLYTQFFAGELKIPPEKEREDLYAFVKRLTNSEFKSPRINLLVQNVTATFSLYNNIWLKKLNEIETGVVKIPQPNQSAQMQENPTTPKKVEEKKPAQEEIPQKPAPAPKAPKKESAPKEKLMGINLNEEDTFEHFFEEYCQYVNKDLSETQKTKVINSLKLRLISENIIEADVILSIEHNKVKLKVKKK